MRHNLRIGLVAGVAAAGAAGGALALYGLGVPFAAGVLGLSAVAGIAVRAAVLSPAPDLALLARVEKLEATLSAIRHDVRGALSPALIMTDRLLAHSDPAIVRAGQAVAKSVDRATTLLIATKDPASPAGSSTD